jgi:uncharacterized protein (DUF1501 family)
MLTRREFVTSASLIALAPTVPIFVSRTARAAAPNQDDRALVVVQLDGGNDALNTAVPYADPNYEKLRPRLRIGKNQLIRISDAIGLHPSLKPLHPLLHAGQLTVIPGVGYPNPNRSHFESMAIWHTARLDPDERKGYGWIGRALDPRRETAYSIGAAIPLVLRGRRSSAVAINKVEEALLADPVSAMQAVGAATGDDLLAFVRRQAVEAHDAADKLAKMAKFDDKTPYPSTGLAERLKTVARLMKSDIRSRVFYTVQSGYDTHAGQSQTHANLLAEFAGAVAAFFKDLETAKLSERVTLLAFSEFGRTVKENASTGTDHGTAGVVFLAGPKVTGGIAGSLPSLTTLVEGEPKMTTDFRQVYATVLTDWLRTSADRILGGQFQPMGLFRS